MLSSEGRRVINNLQRTATLFLTKTVFAVLTTLFSWLSAGLTNKAFAYPFTTNNMYVWEIVTIGGGGLFLSLQPSKERLKGSYLDQRFIQSRRPAESSACSLFAVISLFQSY
jgi:cation-transporting ATPase E